MDAVRVFPRAAEIFGAPRNLDAEVLAGTLVPGATMFWADVPGELTHVTAYDADGEVVDDHAITSCRGGVDCEVR
jgi:hypothetical protein